MISFNESVYRQNNLICMLQDLKNLFVYWDLRLERLKTLNHFLNKIKPGSLIKLCLNSDDSSDDLPVIRQEVTLSDLEPGNYYFRNINPELNYHFELGIRDTNDQFILFARTPMLELHPPQMNSVKNSDLVSVPLFFAGEQFTNLTSSWS